MAFMLEILPHKPEFDLSKQSIEVPGTRSTGQTGHYRNPIWSDLKGEFPLLTLPEVFESGLRQARPKPFLGHRALVTSEPLVYETEYTWQTYADVDRRRRAVGSALENLFQKGELARGEDFETVGIWSINRPEWQIVDMACSAYNKVTVSLYDTLGPDSVEYVINHSELPIIFATSNHLNALLDAASHCPSLKMIVSFDPIDAKLKQQLIRRGKDKGVAVLALSELELAGSQNLLDTIPATLDQVATICYTSGTTSTPKGVILTHRNLSSAAISNLHGIPPFTENFAMFSYLPLAHIYARTFELIVMGLGGRIGYYSGNPLTLLQDVQSLKPEFFPAVPRVLNRIYMSAMANTRAPGLKGILFRRAVETKLATLRTTGENVNWLWDAIVFKKVQAVLGGRVTAITSGSAPINVDTMDFLKIAFACTIIEGYGLTETGATCARTWPKDPTATGTIGGVQMVNEIKLVDVPELGYHANDEPNPRGELHVRGDNVFTRYYKDEKNTSAAIDNEGWFQTGDIAEIDTSGRFKIIDRIKNIMKLSQGEYVALEKIENLYTSCPVVAQVYIHGDSLQDHLLAVVVPDPVVLSILAGEVGYKFDPAAFPAVATAIKDERVQKAVLESMSSQVKRVGGLKGFEIAKSVHLTLDAFSVENDTMTPTFKSKDEKPI